MTVSGESGTSTVNSTLGSCVRAPVSSISTGESETFAASISLTSPVNQSASAIVVRATPPAMVSERFSSGRKI